MTALLNPNVQKDYQNALVFARACSLAYLPATEGRAAFAKELGWDANLVSVDNTQAYVAQDKDNIVVAFRGSESPDTLDGFKDWLLTNAKNFLVLPEGRAGTDFVAAGVGARFHRGFLDALEEIWEPLFQAVDALVQENERPVWITGHSLGGALALMAAWRFQRNFISVHQVYTFGAPMIGNQAAAEAFQKELPNKIFRFVDSRDMVPRLPTFSLFSNEYWHCLTEVILGPQEVADAVRKAAEEAGATTEQQEQLAQGIMDRLWGKLNQGVVCHLMPNYIEHLTKLSGRT